MDNDIKIPNVDFKWTRATIPIKKDNEWQFSVYDGTTLRAILTFDDEIKAKEEYQKFTLDKLIEETNSIDIKLTEEQKLIILKAWEQNTENPPSIAHLIGLAFPDIEEKLKDGRSNHGKVVKHFLVERGFFTPLAKESKQKPAIILNEEQKEYILNNCKTMKGIEMARELFQNPSLSPVSIENRAVINHLKTIDPKIIYGGEVPEVDYKAPKRVEHVLARIKKYVSVTEDWDLRKLTPMQKKWCDNLMHYLHDFRFKRQIDSYEKVEDKITFESEFIKYTYNKAELEQEEISQYIALCSFVVTEFNIKQDIEILQANIRQEYDEHGRVSGNLVDALQSSREELNSCTLRQGKLYEALTEKRSEKLSKELKDKASLLNIIAAWKQQESRQQMLKLANERKNKLRKEIHELESLDEMKIRLLGLSVDEIVDG